VVVGRARFGARVPHPSLLKKIRNNIFRILSHGSSTFFLAMHQVRIFKVQQGTGTLGGCRINSYRRFNRFDPTRLSRYHVQWRYFHRTGTGETLTTGRFVDPVPDCLPMTCSLPGYRLSTASLSVENPNSHRGVAVTRPHPGCVPGPIAVCVLMGTLSGRWLCAGICETGIRTRKRSFISPKKQIWEVESPTDRAKMSTFL
jgi:hypothetical protein